MSLIQEVRIMLWKRSMADYIAVLFGSGAARVVALFNNVLIARFLGSEKFGQFSLFYIFMLFAWIIPQALDTTFVKFAKSHETAQHISDYWRANVQLKMLYCTLMFICAWPVGNLLASYFIHKQQVSWLLSLGLICGALLSIMNSVSSSFQVKGKFGYFAILQGLYAIAVCSGLIILFFLTPVRNVIFVVCIYISVSAIIGIISSLNIFRKTPKIFQLDSLILNQVLHFGKWIFLTAIAFYTFPRIDGMVIARYLDIEKLGLYSVATQLTMVVSVVTGSMSAVFLPRAMQSLKDTNALQQYFKDAARPITIVLGSIILLEITAPVLIENIYGHAYALATTPLRVLLIGYIFSTLYLPLSFLFYAMERPHVRFLLETGKMLLVLVLFIWLIPQWGLIGAAVSMTIAMAANCLFSGTILLFVYHHYWKFPFLHEQ